MTKDSRVLALPMTAAYLRLIERRFGSTPARRAALRAGIRGASERAAEAGVLDAEITVGTQLRQLANLHAFARPDWGLELGAALDGVTETPTNFGRACRSWFGASPRALRAQLGEGPIAGASALG